MRPKWMRITKKTAYGTERPEGQTDLGTGAEVTAVAEEQYDFTQDTHRKDILSIIVRTLLTTYGYGSAAGIVRQDLELVLAVLNPDKKEEKKEETPQQGNIIWP